MVEYKITSRKEKWTRLVDIVTIIWLGVFAIGFFSTESIAHICNILNIAILVIFVADLVVIYKFSSNWRMFLRKHWFDIIMVIPYLRVFRIFRIFRLLKILRIAKVARAAKVAKMATKSSKVIRFGKVNKLMLVGHETYDLFRTIRGRMFNRCSGQNIRMERER